MTAPDAPRTRPVWREPMVWLVVAIPLASMVASFVLLYSAARSTGNNDAVTDQVQRTAQIQVQDLAADLAARERGLIARMSVEDGRLVLHADAGDFPRDTPLELALQHPLRAREDIHVTLQPDADGWNAQQSLPLDHDWNLTLSPPDGSWRLQGRLSRDQRSTTLRPALEAK